MDTSPPETVTVDALAANLNVNLYGAVRLSNAVLPAMRTAGGGRFIATSSLAGLLGLPMLPLYASTKFALEGYMESMAAAYAGIGIHFSIVAPGPVSSALVANAAAPNEAAPAELRPAIEAFQHFIEDLVANSQSPDDCAEYFIKAATDERPQLRYMTYKPIHPKIRAKFVDLTGQKTLEALKSMVAPRTETSS